MSDPVEYLFAASLHIAERAARSPAPRPFSASSFVATRASNLSEISSLIGLPALPLKSTTILSPSITTLLLRQLQPSVSGYVKHLREQARTIPR